MHTASDVAKWILQRNDIEDMLGDAERISNLKLQKLLYYAQGTFLAMTGRRLFADDIVKWEHGPVVVSVYHEYSSNGRNGIIYTDEMAPQEEYTKEEESILEMVYNYFGQYSAWKLRNMSHKERPWITAAKNGVISPQVIEEYFKEVYVDESA